jgi:hypothetical protein
MTDGSILVQCPLGIFGEYPKSSMSLSLNKSVASVLMCPSNASCDADIYSLLAVFVNLSSEFSF